MLINEFVVSQLVRSKREELRHTDSVHRALVEYINEFKAMRENERRARKNNRR